MTTHIHGAWHLSRLCMPALIVLLAGCSGGSASDRAMDPPEDNGDSPVPLTFFNSSQISSEDELEADTWNCTSTNLYGNSSELSSDYFVLQFDPVQNRGQIITQIPFNVIGAYSVEAGSSDALIAYFSLEVTADDSVIASFVTASTQDDWSLLDRGEIETPDGVFETVRFSSAIFGEAECTQAARADSVLTDIEFPFTSESDTPSGDTLLLQSLTTTSHDDPWTCYASAASMPWQLRITPVEGAAYSAATSGAAGDVDTSVSEIGNNAIMFSGNQGDTEVYFNLEFDGRDYVAGTSSTGGNLHCGRNLVQEYDPSSNEPVYAPQLMSFRTDNRLLPDVASWLCYTSFREMPITYQTGISTGVSFNPSPLDFSYFPGDNGKLKLLYADGSAETIANAVLGFDQISLNAISSVAGSMSCDLEVS